MWASFAEIYKEQIFDLLDVSTISSAARITRPSTLQLRDGDGRPYICGLREIHVTSAEEAWRLVQIGRENQHIAATRMNRASSRSHSIFTLRLIQVADVDQPNVARVASLSFCDLAGSERNTAMGGLNERLKEANNINLSLLALGRCIEALRKNQARRDQSAVGREIVVPFRDSRLTRLFQSFLCGEGRVIMITNVSPCANVFDETLHAVNYSALASQVIVGPSAPLYAAHSTSILVPPQAEKRKVSVLGKHEAAAHAPKAVLEKKRKCDTIKEAVDKVEDNGELEDNEDLYSSDEDVPESWHEERQKLLSAIQTLHDALTKEQQSKNARETQIRAEVCEEMQRQLVRIESEYQENIRRQGEIMEEKYDRKMEIYMEAVQKSCKRQRRENDEDDYVPSIELHAAEMKLSKLNEEVKELKSKNAEMKKELATARENISKLSAERDALAEKLTKSEFSTSDALRQEKTQARAECAKLRNTVEELTKKLNDADKKLNDAEDRHEISCRQLRRDKAQLQQKLDAAEKSAANRDQQPQNADIVNGESVKNEVQSKTAEISELTAALEKERDTVCHLEQRLNEVKVVEKTWAERCKEVESLFQEKTCELTSLREKYDALEHDMQEAVKTLEETKQNHSQAEEMLQTVRNELVDKDEQLMALTTVSDSLKEEINHITVEFENERKNLTAELHANEGECEKVKTEMRNLKQQASDAVDNDKINTLQHELDVMKEKLKQLEDEKASAVGLMNDEIAKRTTQLQQGKDELVGKMSEIDRLEKELEAERGNRCRLEDTVAEYEKELTSSKSDLSQEQGKHSALRSSLESLQSELSVAKNARQTAEEEIARHLSAISALKAKTENAEAEVNVSKEQLRNSEDQKTRLEQQLSSSSQLIEKLQEKERSNESELADKDKKLQASEKTVGVLKKKIEQQQVQFDSASKDALSDKEVINHMKLTITEQEATMKTQDLTLHEQDKEMKSLKERLVQVEADHHNESESFNNQIRQKNTTVRELEKKVEKITKSCECLEKDVRDSTSELRSSEHNLAEVQKELASTKQELEKAKSDETSAKSLAKRELELSGLRKQLQVAEDKFQKCDREMVKLKNQFETFKVDKEKELSAWREKRDKLVTELENSISEKDAEIEHLKAIKTGRNKRDRQPSSEEGDRQIESLRKELEQLQRAASAKDQTIVEMRNQNLKLQQQICQLSQQANVSDAEDNTRRKTTSRKSRIPTSQRLPLQASDGNADISVGVLADGGVAIDLDETIGTRKRSTRRYHTTQENSHPKPLELVDEQFTRSTRTRSKRTTGVVDVMESTITEEPEGPSQARRLRSRHH